MCLVEAQCLARTAPTAILAVDGEGMTARSILLAVLVAAIWGGNFVAVKFGTRDFPPIFLLALRFFFVAALVLPFVRLLPRAQIVPVLTISTVLGVLHFGLMFVGISRIEASTAAIAGQLGVPFSTVLAVILFKDRLGWRRLLGTLVAFSGVAVLAGAPKIGNDLAGLLMVVMAAFAWALANTLIKRFGPFDTYTLTAWMATFACPQLLLLSLLLEDGQWQSLMNASWPAWLALFYTAVASTIIAYAVWYSLIGRNDVSKVVPFTLLAPVFAIAAAVLLLGEPLTLPLVGGGVLTIAGVALCEFRFRRRVPRLRDGTGRH
jgi:O-acetylserine/cysteine efflux transporter